MFKALIAEGIKGFKAYSKDLIDSLFVLTSKELFNISVALKAIRIK
jgi:hypothetical protein